MCLTLLLLYILASSASPILKKGVSHCTPEKHNKQYDKHNVDPQLSHPETKHTSNSFASMAFDQSLAFLLSCSALKGDWPSQHIYYNVGQPKVIFTCVTGHRHSSRMVL